MTPQELRLKYPHASESFIRRNAGLEPDPETLIHVRDSEAMQQAVVLGIRATTDESKLNQLESQYLCWLRSQNDFWIGVQCWTLKLGHDCRYTPDFLALDGCGLRAVDTKGEHTWEDSLIKLRVAARLYPFIRFLIAKRNGGVWEHREIKP